VLDVNADWADVELRVGLQAPTAENIGLAEPAIPFTRSTDESKDQDAHLIGITRSLLATSL